MLLKSNVYTNYDTVTRKTGGLPPGPHNILLKLPAMPPLNMHGF